MEPEHVADAEIPRLIREARGVYSQFIRHALHHADCADLPKNGPYVIGNLFYDRPAHDVFASLDLNGAARANLLTRLLERGYVEPGPGLAVDGIPDLVITDRGRRAASAIGGALQDVNRRLAHRMTEQEFAGFVAGFEALHAIKDEAGGDHHH